MSSKSKKKAEKTRQELGNRTTNRPPAGQADCGKPKHFFAIVVKDSDGNAVTNLSPRIELNDGSVITPGLDGQGKYNTGKILDGTANCKVSFPSLYDVDWWEGSKSAAGSASQRLRAVDGECVVSLAHAAGFRNYHAVWDRSENAVLKQNRSNPNSLANNDEVSAPDQKTKEISKGVD